MSITFTFFLARDRIVHFDLLSCSYIERL